MARTAKMGLKRDVDTVLHLPLRYEDETTLLPVSEAIARAGLGLPVQVEGVVTSSEVTVRPRRQLVVKLADDSGELVLRFLNFYGSRVKLMAGARACACAANCAAASSAPRWCTPRCARWARARRCRTA